MEITSHKEGGGGGGGEEGGEGGEGGMYMVPSLLPSLDKKELRKFWVPFSELFGEGGEWGGEGGGGGGVLRFGFYFLEEGEDLLSSFNFIFLGEKNQVFNNLEDIISFDFCLMGYFRVQ